MIPKFGDNPASRATFQLLRVRTAPFTGFTFSGNPHVPRKPEEVLAAQCGGEGEREGELRGVRGGGAFEDEAFAALETRGTPEVLRRPPFAGPPV